MKITTGLDRFLEKYNISKEKWDKANIEFKILKEISDKHQSKIKELNNNAIYISNILQQCPEVHSVRWRIKDSEHLMEKIVRKRADGIPKYKEINSSNYSEIITDLSGIRILHLFKNEWKIIQDYILKNWEPIETPIAYLHKGDDNSIRENYEKNGCEVKIHSEGYRSVHYIIENSPTKEKNISEIQVRTIFEEGWSEIDHRIRYPNFSNNQLVSYFLNIFNKMAASADEMGSFVNNLVTNLSSYDNEIRIAEEKNKEQLEKIEDLISKLSTKEQDNLITEDKLQDLQNEIKSLKENIKDNNHRSFINSDYASISTDTFYQSINNILKKSTLSSDVLNNSMGKILKNSTLSSDVLNNSMGKILKNSTISSDVLNNSMGKILKNSTLSSDVLNNSMGNILKNSTFSPDILNNSMSNILKKNNSNNLFLDNNKEEDGI